MIGLFLWIEGFLLLILLVFPTLAFLGYGVERRRIEILSGIDSRKDRALLMYFKKFQPEFKVDEQNVKSKFRAYYLEQYGPRQYVCPLFLLVLIAGTLIAECSHLLLKSFAGRYNILERPEAIMLFSVLGAYLWVVNDHIHKWWNSDLSHKDLYWASFRFALAVPMGYAVTRILGKDADVALALAFFLGAFPLQSLLSLFRRAAQLMLKSNGSPEDQKSEVLELQGVNMSVVNRLLAEGITTICQLAYADPIRLTIRTNMGYSFIVDLMSQAQLKLYTRESHDIWQKMGLRGGFEVVNLDSGLKSRLASYRQDAEKLVAEIAERTKIPRAAVREIIWEVCNDPYMKFLYSSWTG